MRIIITENQKNKLFIPRKLTGEDSRFKQWNNMQPIVDGVRINQYDIDGRKTRVWHEEPDEDEYYEENVEIQSKGEYKNGLRDGNWKYYYNGRLGSNGEYKNGEADGIWEYYNENGEMDLKRLFNKNRYIKDLPLTESKKLFIPRKIDEREIEFEKLKKQTISDIKSIIKKEGSINYDDLEDDSPTYEPENRYTTIAFFTRYELERVEITIYNAVTGKEMDSYFINYEELDLKELFEIKEVLKSR
jgi:hypothetical protein